MQIKDLLDDALLFNPWISTKKEPEAIPEDERENIREKLREDRRKWLEEKDGSSSN